MEKALRYYSCGSDLKAEALQEALVKIWVLLDKMLNGNEVERTQDIVALVTDKRAAWTNIYDFSSPVYAFARRIARNELMTQLRKESTQPIYPGPWEDMEGRVTSVSPPALPEDEDSPFETWRLQLKFDLARLLEIIQHDLTSKPREVVCQTLAAQPQFWLALELTGLSQPAAIPPRSRLASDAEIGMVLKLTENSVRVHRAHAKKRAQEIDPMLGPLFDRLITRRGGNEGSDGS
jgi:hypothetical protein